MKPENLTINEIIEQENLKVVREKKYPIRKYDENNNEIYFEDSDGFWVISKYDKNNNKIYRENSDGRWEKKDGKNTLEFKDGKYFLNEKLMKKLTN